MKAMARHTDNAPSGLAPKIAIRRAILDAVTPARVFDAFAGAGVMYRSVWRHAAEYVGCDLKWFRDSRLAFVADNRRVMRAIDLSPFTIFDIDAYGCPWEQALIIAARRPVATGERVGMVLTEGSRMKLTMGSFPAILSELAGIDKMQVGGNRALDQVIDRAIAGLCQRWGVVVERQWRDESRAKGQCRPVYIGLVFVGVPR